MRLTERERLIRSMEEEDISNPEIYPQLFELAFGIIQYKKWVELAKDAKEIAEYIAEDMFLTIRNGTLIYAPLEWIRRRIQGYIVRYRKENNTEIISIADDPALKEGIEYMSTGSSKSTQQDYVRIYERDYIDKLGLVVNEIMDSSRYKKNSTEYLNLRTSLMLSVLRGSQIDYHLDEECSRYLHQLIIQFKELVKANVAEFSSDFIEYEQSPLPGACEINNVGGD